jgi:elongation factor 2
MQECIKPVLMVNKVDRAIMELCMQPENMYKSFERVIQKTNVVCQNYANADMGEVELDPRKGNVAFGSGKDCWGFTLGFFAETYSKKFGIDKEKMM